MADTHKRPAPRRRAAKSVQAAGTAGAGGLRIVQNPVAQREDAIDNSGWQDDTSAGLRVVQAPRTAAESPAPSETKPDPGPQQRLANGAKVLTNPAPQRSEKIAARPVPADPGSEIAHKKLFTRFEEAFLAQDVAALAGCLSPAFEWRKPNGEVFCGKAAALEEMARLFALPEGPRFSRSVWRFRGKTVIQTYRVEFKGPDGQWRKTRGMDLYKIRQGLIVRKDAYWKMVS